MDEAKATVGIRDADIAKIKRNASNSKASGILLVIISFIIGFALGGPIGNALWPQSSYPFVLAPLAAELTPTARRQRTIVRGVLALFAFLIGLFISASAFTVVTLYGVKSGTGSQ